MHIPTLIHPTLVLLLTLTPTLTLSTKPKTPKNAILLSQVKSLTLRSGSKTSHRRVPAIPQLTCKGPGCRHHTVEIMRCANQGSDYSCEDIQWSCTANIPDDFKLGSTDVICEGYGSADDEYVLKGSCGLEYRLLLTENGEEKYGKGGWGGYVPGEKGSDMGKWLFMGIFVAVAGWILYSLWLGIQNAPGGGGGLPRRPGGFWGGGSGPGGGGGGGGNDPWDPPPPYPGTGKRYNYGGTHDGWRPGFWSGALGGAAAGYLAGNRGGRQQEQQPRNGFFGGNGGGSNWGMGSPSTRSSGSSSGSSSRHESTGFGSTTRR